MKIHTRYVIDAIQVINAIRKATELLPSAKPGNAI
jgi:hypothetical protein